MDAARKSRDLPFDWTPARLSFLRLHYRTLGRSGIAERWGVKPIVIGRKAYTEGLCLPVGQLQRKLNAERRLIRMRNQDESDRRDRFDWTPERLRQLKEEYELRGAAELSREWGMTFNAVTQRAYRMGLTKGKVGRPRRGPTLVEVSDSLKGARGDGPRIMETVAKRKGSIRQCAWVWPGNGFQKAGKRCGNPAESGAMWCASCQEHVAAVRSEVA